MKINETPKTHKKAIFLTRQQIKTAFEEFEINDPWNKDGSQSGWYRFKAYATEEEMNVMEMKALFNRVHQLEDENALLQDQLSKIDEEPVDVCQGNP